MKRDSIDLNADMGESFGAWSMGDDGQMLGVVTSANIACGFHAGDPAVMWDTVHKAAQLGVCIGAHVGYDDLAGFGRRRIEVKPHAIRTGVLYQLGALGAMATAAGTDLRYVKPHGALYDAVNAQPSVAEAVVDAINDYDPELMLLILPNRAGVAAAERGGIMAVGEAFADRAYAKDGTLVPRSVQGSVLSDPLEVAKQAVRIALDSTVTSIEGLDVRLDGIASNGIASICVHGDTVGAVELAIAVRSALEGAGIAVRSFA